MIQSQSPTTTRTLSPTISPATSAKVQPDVLVPSLTPSQMPNTREGEAAGGLLTLLHAAFSSHNVSTKRPLLPSDDFLIPDHNIPMLTVSKRARVAPQPVPKHTNSQDTQAAAPKAKDAKCFACTVSGCNKVFKDRSGLRKHRTSKHSFCCPHFDCKT